MLKGRAEIFNSEHTIEMKELFENKLLGILEDLSFSGSAEDNLKVLGALSCRCFAQQLALLAQIKIIKYLVVWFQSFCINV